MPPSAADDVLVEDVPKKRGRGRPRKSAAPASPEEIPDTAVDHAEDPEWEPNAAGTANDHAAEATAEEVAGSDSDGQDEKPSPPRKSGRRRRPRGSRASPSRDAPDAGEEGPAGENEHEGAGDPAQVPAASPGKKPKGSS